MISCQHIYKRGSNIHPKGSVCNEECKKKEEKLTKRCKKHYGYDQQFELGLMRCRQALIESFTNPVQVRTYQQTTNVEETTDLPPPTYEEAIKQKKE